MSDEQISSTFEGSSVPQIEKADTSFSGDLSLVKALKGGLPKYQGINDYALKKRLIEDDNFFSAFSNDALSLAMTPELMRVQRDDPETFLNYTNNFRKNLRSDLVMSAHVGETSKDTLINHTANLRKNPNNLPVDTYKNVVNNNPKLFEEFGLIQDNELIYGDDQNDSLAFANEVSNNPKLHKKIVQQRFKEFQSALTKSHNNPALVDDLNKRTQAWVVFDNFGSEGLTQYINLLQRDDTDADITERYAGGQEAEEFFRNATTEGKNVFNLIEEFVAGDGEPLTFIPLEPRQDLTVNVPDDHNFYTMNFYGFDGKEFTEKDPIEATRKFIDRHTPERFKEFIDLDEMKSDGPYSSAWRHATYSIYKEAHEGAVYTIEDLMDTVKMYADHQSEDRYRIEVNEVPVKVQLAIDALRHDDEANYMFQYISDGVYDFRPKRREEATTLWEKVTNFLHATKDEIYRDNEGELQVRTTPDTGGFTGLYNSIATIGLGVADMGMRFFVEPLVRVTGNITGDEGTQAFAAQLQDWTGVNMSTAMSRETHGVVPNAIGEIAPFVQYMGAMMIGGSGLIRLGAKAFGAITKAKKVYDLQRYAKGMIGSGRLRAMAGKLNHAVKNKTPWAVASVKGRSPWVTGVGVFYTGGALIEGTQPKDQSFYNMIPQVFGYEPTNSVSEFYKTSSDANRVALNIGASLVMDGFFDTIIAGSRFLTAKAGQRYFNRTEFKGITYVGPEAGTKFNGYKVVNEPQFRHEVTEFFHNLTNDLDKLPIGSVGDSMARGVLKGGEYKTLHDFTRAFLDDSGHVLKNVKADIEDNIRVLHRSLAKNFTLTDTQIKGMVDEQYKSFLGTLSTQLYGTLKTSSEDLPLRFARTIEEQATTIKEFTVDGEPIRPDQLGSYSGRSGTPKLVVKDGKVYEVDPQYWTIDLAESIRGKALAKETDDIIQRKVDELGTSKTSDKIEEITREVNETIGRPVQVEGKTGYVVDYDKKGYTVRTVDGDIKRTGELVPSTAKQIDEVVEETRRLITQAGEQFEQPLRRRKPVTVIEDYVNALADLSRKTTVNGQYSLKFQDFAKTTGKFINKKLSKPYC